MNVLVNGQQRAVTEGTTIAKLLDELKIVPARVVVEVNLTILKRVEHPTTILQEGDQVEIVQFVGGGSKNWLQAAGPRLQVVKRT